MATRTASREIEGRDSVGMYLDEIARTPLLDAITEVELSKTIEVGLFAAALLEQGRVGRRKGGAPKSATEDELRWMVEEYRVSLFAQELKTSIPVSPKRMDAQWEKVLP